jgi:hypothetical protein
VRIRSIKPETYKYNALSKVSREHRWLNTAMWSYVDDNGVGVDDYRLIAADLCPIDEDPLEAREFVREGLATLARTFDEASGDFLLVRYTVNGRAFLFPTTFVGDLAQRVDKPNKPRYPRPDHPDAVILNPVTSGSSDPRESVATPSRDPRESVVPGTEEQGNRGTEEKETCAPQAEHETALELPPPKPKKTHRRPYGDDDFDAFWEAYPRKDDPKKAWSCWQAAVKIAPAEAIIAGAERYRDDPNRSDQFTKLATTWLNAGSWANGPLPSRGGGNVVDLRPRQAAPQAGIFARAYERLAAQEAGQA